MFDSYLSVQLAAVREIDQPAERGRQLEKLVADIFRRHHFDVRLSPGVARPRQTDVLAVKTDEVYLVECKWRADRATVDDIDSLRSRLLRTTGNVVGVLLSVPGFSGTVLHDVEHRRDQPVLLISGDELQQLADGSERLPDLLWRKKEALRTDGKVLLDEPEHRRGLRRRLSSLPASDRQFVTPDGGRSQVIDCGGDFGQFVFAHELPDIDWVTAPGFGVTLDLRPDVEDETALRGLIDKLADLGWTSADARWRFGQAHVNWHGLGARAFAEELPRWRQRSRTSNAHHTEEVCYLDRCSGGFYTLAADLAVHRIRRASAISLSFQLEGVPLDHGHLLQLARSLGVHTGLYFRSRGGKSVSRKFFGYRNLRPLTLVGYVARMDAYGPFSGEEWVTGVVVLNPFYKNAPTPSEALPADIEFLRDSEYLVCDLVHHHPLEGWRCEYKLRGFEHAWTSDAMVCRPLVDWERERASPEAEDATAGPG